MKSSPTEGGTKNSLPQPRQVIGNLLINPPHHTLLCGQVGTARTPRQSRGALVLVGQKDLVGRLLAFGHLVPNLGPDLGHGLAVVYWERSSKSPSGAAKSFQAE